MNDVFFGCATRRLDDPFSGKAFGEFFGVAIDIFRILDQILEVVERKRFVALGQDQEQAHGQGRDDNQREQGGRSVLWFWWSFRVLVHITFAGWGAVLRQEQSPLSGASPFYSGHLRPICSFTKLCRSRAASGNSNGIAPPKAVKHHFGGWVIMHTKSKNNRQDTFIL